MADKKSIHIISLIGPKHTGKTSVGKNLALVSGGRFVDLDSLIESRTGKSVRSLYQEGLAVFRSAELEAVRYIFSEPIEAEHPLIIATGGGIIDNEEAFAFLRTASYLINLSTSAALAWERIENNSARSGSLPPFLRTDNPKETHRELHERRTYQYITVADLNFETESKSARLIAEEIYQVLVPHKAIELDREI